MESFTTKIADPTGLFVDIWVTVEYEMRDRGTMMKRNENVRAVLLSVKDMASPYQDYLSRLDWVTYTRLKSEAADHARDSADETRGLFKPEHAG